MFIKKIVLIMMSLSVLCLSSCAGEQTSSSSESSINPTGVDLYRSDDIDENGNFIYDIGNNNSHTTVLPDIYVHFIDVGQADCTLIQMPNGNNYLIDCGNNADSKDLEKYFNSVGVKGFSAIIATHPHEDHVGSLGYIVSKYPVDKVYMPVINEELMDEKAVSDGSVYQAVLRILEKNNIEIVNPSVGETIFSTDDLRFFFLYDGQLGEDDFNTYSLITKLIYGDTSFIFTGDADKEVEEWEMERFGCDVIDPEHQEERGLDCDILKAAHHGSKTANSIEYLETTTPDAVFIPCEEGNRYGHPHKAAIDNFMSVNADIYYMDTVGTCIVVANNAYYEIYDNITNAPLGSQNWDGQIDLPYNN